MLLRPPAGSPGKIIDCGRKLDKKGCVMRSTLAIIIVLGSSIGATAQEPSTLPDFFQQSFDALANRPLAPMPSARPEETGSIPADEVPMPPRRSEAGSNPGKAFALKIPADVRVRSATAFTVENRTYQLVSTEGLGIDRSCTNEASGRCIYHPMRALKRAIAGQTLQCRQAEEGNQVSCRR
jgi:hypothetical protein